jgi:hypothetical protein
LGRFDLKAIAEKWRTHQWGPLRWLGTILFVAVLIAAPVSLILNWGKIWGAMRSIGYQVQSIAVLSPLARVLLFFASVAVLAALTYYAGGARPRRRKLVAFGLTSIPLLVMALSVATTRGYAEVPARNIGIIASQPLSTEIFAAARQQGQDDGATGIGVYEYDLSKQGIDAVPLRHFIDTNNIRYLIVSSAMAPTNFASVHDLIRSRGLTIITTPETNADGIADNVVGVFVSPEAEADQIEEELVADGASRVLLIYNKPDQDLDTFENRLRTKLVRSRALNVGSWSTEDLRSDDNYLLPQLKVSETIVLADSGPRSIDLLRRIRALNPSARLISTSRVLDHTDLQTLQGLRVETLLPWPIVDAYRRASIVGDANAARLPSPVETATASAVRLAMLVERHLGNLRPPAIRQAMMVNKTPWLEDLERYYGEVSFAEGRIPHLRIGALRMSDLSAPNRPRTRQ